VPKEHVARALQHSFNFGLFDGDKLVGFARVVTDFADYAYLSDVFILESHQGRGLGQWLLETILACPALQGLGRFALDTRDAQEFYRRFGFQELERPETHLEIRTRRPWFKPE
jgi:GNAT superfamily N-acetyltransferase